VPITPFHLGSGLLIAELTPASFAAFVWSNVIIDVESVYHLVAGMYPVHTFLHTAVGATLAAVAAIGLTLAGRAAWARWRGAAARESLVAVAAGALAGAWSHVLLDAIMHADLRPLAPWSSRNPLLGAVPLSWLHLACAIAGGIGVALLVRRRWALGNARQG